MRFETRLSPEGLKYQHAVPEGPQDLPKLTAEEKERLLDAYTRAYEEGRAVRGVTRSKNGRCIVGWMCQLNIPFRGHPKALLDANDQGRFVDRDFDQHTITPSAFAEVCRLIKECPEP